MIICLVTVTILFNLLKEEFQELICFKKKNKRAELTSELITMSFKRNLNLLFPLLFGQHAFNMQINCPSKISFECITLMKNKKTVKWRIYPKTHTEFINP